MAGESCVGKPSKPDVQGVEKVWNVEAVAAAPAGPVLMGD